MELLLNTIIAGITLGVISFSVGAIVATIPSRDD